MGLWRHAQALLGKSDEDAEDEDGNTPGWLALEEKHVDVLELLLGEGADVALQCQGGATYLHLVRGGQGGWGTGR